MIIFQDMEGRNQALIDKNIGHLQIFQYELIKLIDLLWKNWK